MKQQEIKYLLEKYYSADTDLSEEKQLREYFLGNQVSDDLQASRDQFIFFSGLAEERPEATGLEDKIRANLLEGPPVVPLQKKKSGPIIGRIITAVAAGFLLIFVVKSLEESFSSGMNADKLTTSLTSVSCGTIEQCYQYTDEALRILSEGISPDENHHGNRLMDGLFSSANLDDKAISLVVDEEMLKKLAELEGQKIFQSLTREVSSIKISRISDKDVKKKDEIASYFEQVTNSPEAHLLNKSDAKGFSFYVLDLPDNEQAYIYYHQGDTADLLIELSGSIDLSELKEYSKD
ncbi:MAG: hypothetical protein K9H64_16280 [Bacteroidales bacterium]|nr:hypothetical protein [Bacteroidales bacterium]MCF8457527.1 hypothetical protein [Bacteroidales bacterium]